MSTEAATETETQTVLTYIGLRRTTKGKSAHFYLDGERERGFSKPLSAAQKIGALVEVTMVNDGQVYTAGPKGPRIVGLAEVPDETLASWQMASDLVKVQDAQAATERRLAREAGTPLDDAIETIRQALDGLPWTQRAAAVNMIVSRIR